MTPTTFAATRRYSAPTHHYCFLVSASFATPTPPAHTPCLHSIAAYDDDHDDDAPCKPQAPNKNLRAPKAPSNQKALRRWRRWPWLVGLEFNSLGAWGLLFTVC